MAKRLYIDSATGFATSQDRRDVKSAWDPNYDPYYGDKPEGQAIDGRSFADLRDDMNDRRRQTARRMDC